MFGRSSNLRVCLIILYIYTYVDIRFISNSYIVCKNAQTRLIDNSNQFSEDTIVGTGMANVIRFDYVKITRGSASLIVG